ncbi:MAG: hypothetical protein PHU63_03105 [Candidatus ainarchaeum sp.]|nr:hypothetical protein [Candidatus ainarchaeum sp.]
MVDIKSILSIVRIPLVILVTLTCLGILINFTDDFLIITIWWGFVLILCALLSVWAGFNTAKNKFTSIESGIAGLIIWIIPGTIGLVIVGITQFINALLWGNVEGYEFIAFIIGAVIIFILLGIGSIITFLLGWFGSWLNRKITNNKK